jgi:hypothetical protein
MSNCLNMCALKEIRKFECEKFRKYVKKEIVWNEFPNYFLNIFYYLL